MDRLVDMDFATSVTGYSRSTIYRAIANGEIAARNFKPGGRKMRMSESSLRAWYKGKVRSFRE